MIELDSFNAFRHLTVAGKELLKRGLQIKRYQRKTTIVEKGQTVSGAFFVIQGKLRVFTISPDGTEATLYFIRPDEFCVFTLNCIFNDLLYPAWVQTDIDTTVAIIPSQIYRALFQTETVIQDVTVRAFSTIVNRLMTELDNVHSYNLEKRLMNFLLLSASSDGTLKITQSEIGAHLGTTREVVARMLGRFVKAKQVETSRGKIRLLKPKELLKL